MIRFIWEYGENNYDELIDGISRNYVENIKPHTSNLKAEINSPIVSFHNAAKILIVSHYTLDNNFIHNVTDNHTSYAKLHDYDYWFRNGFLDLSLFNLKKKKYGMGLCWQKMVAVQQAMKIKDQNRKYKYEWVMWVDGDAVFTNLSYSIKNLLERSEIKSEDYLLIARDMSCDDHNSCLEHACINSGVWLVRNNHNGRLFVNTIIKSFPYYKDIGLPEQSAIGDYVFGFLKLQHHEVKITEYLGKNKCNLPAISGVKIVPGHYMNSPYIPNLKRKIHSAWQAGDYIMHFAGTGRVPSEREECINNFLKCMVKHSQDLIKCENAR